MCKVYLGQVCMTLIPLDYETLNPKQVVVALELLGLRHKH